MCISLKMGSFSLVREMTYRETKEEFVKVNHGDGGRRAAANQVPTDAAVI